MARSAPGLKPLLGRAIGLVVPGPVGTPRRQRRSGRRSGGADGHASAVHDAAVGELRVSVSRRLTAALGLDQSRAEWRGHGCGRDVDRLFRSLMLQPTPVSTSAAWLDRLVLLHECYEQALAQLGPAGATPTPTPTSSPDTARSGA